MITKVQGKTVSGELSVKACPRLNPLEKAMLRWAVVDPEDRVLDACVGRGLMAEYLRRNMQCEVCGVSSDMEEVRSARARLQSCDIVYAPVGDIPWREGAFDTVLMQWKGDPDSLDRMLGEVLRVLKPGGQLVLGAACWPAAMNALRRWMSAGTESTPVNRCTLQTRLTDLSFEQVSWQRTGLGTGVMTAWKRKPALDGVQADGGMIR